MSSVIVDEFVKNIDVMGPEAVRSLSDKCLILLSHSGNGHQNRFQIVKTGQCVHFCNYDHCLCLLF